MKKKTALGRPPKKPEEILSASIMFYMLPAEKTAYTECAAGKLMTVSEWIRTILNQEVAQQKANGK